jgi:hypothetical protein
LVCRVFGGTLTHWLDSDTPDGNCSLQRHHWTKRRGTKQGRVVIIKTVGTCTHTAEGCKTSVSCMHCIRTTDDRDRSRTSVVDGVFPGEPHRQPGVWQEGSTRQRHMTDSDDLSLLLAIKSWKPVKRNDPEKGTGTRLRWMRERTKSPSYG